MKKKYFLFGVIFGIVAVFGISYLTTAIHVDTYVSDYGYTARMTVDPTGYGITLQVLHDRYSEFLNMEIQEDSWQFHFNQTNLGMEQRDNFAELVESIMKVNARFFATDTEIYRCKPEYIPQLDKYAMLCDELF